MVIAVPKTSACPGPTSRSSLHTAAVAAWWAVLSCAAPAAHAQASTGVTLYGVADAGFYSRQLAGEARQARVDSGLLSTSRFGLRGSEDLGGGLSAVFLLSSHLRLDTGEPGRHPGDTAAGRFWSSEGSVGLQGPAGLLRAGRLVTGSFVQNGQFSPFGDSTALGPFMLHTMVGSQPMQAAHGISDALWNNAVAYTTPAAAGFNGQLLASAGEGGTAGRRAEATLNYRGSALAASASHARIDRASYANPRTATDPAGAPYVVNAMASTQASVSYDFTAFKAYAQLARGRLQPQGLPTIDLDTIGAAAEVRLGQGRLMAGWARTTREQVGVSERRRSTTSVGYAHALSRRTAAYGIVIDDRATGLASGTGVALGLRHTF